MGRLTDNDKQFGPITYGPSEWDNWSIILSSYGDCDDTDDERASLVVYAFNYVFRMWIGNLIKPVTYKVKANWDEATVKRLGRDWYPYSFKRKYGFSLSNGFLQVYFGMYRDDDFFTYYTEDGFIDYKPQPVGVVCFPFKKRQWSWFLPWTQFRLVRFTLLKDKDEVFYTIRDNSGIKSHDHYDKEAECPSVSFTVKDYDGEIITAKTIIKETEYKKGEGKFNWLSWFTKPTICRRLDIEFDKEQGDRKGSWKGGILGTSIEIDSNMTHEDGIKQYCAKNKIDYIPVVN